MPVEMVLIARTERGWTGVTDTVCTASVFTTISVFCQRCLKCVLLKILIPVLSTTWGTSFGIDVSGGGAGSLRKQQQSSNTLSNKCM